MQPKNTQNKRWKKIIRVCMDIALVGIGGWMIFSLGQDITLSLTFFFIFCGGPVLAENAQYLRKHMGRGGKKVKEDIPPKQGFRIVIVSVIGLCGSEITLFILILFSNWISLVTFILFTLGLTVIFALLLYRGVRAQFEADYARETSIVARKETIRRRKLQLRKVVIPFYLISMCIPIGIGPFYNIIDEALQHAAYSIFFTLFSISIAMGTLMGQISIRAKDLLLAHLKGGPNAGKDGQGVDIPRCSRELGMAKFSLRIFLKEEVKKGTITGTFNKQQTYFGIDPQDPMLGRGTMD